MQYIFAFPATAEAARRYYSTKQYLFTTGNWNVTTGIWPQNFPRAFGKFFDFFEPSNYLPRPDNKHYVLFSLKKTLERFAHFPIRTKEGQPRFLLVTVDARTGDAVTFDSYAEQAKYHDDTMSIHNKNGVEIDHALATGTFPDFFDYPKFKVDNSEMGLINEEHIFWDGGFRSNTPLREVIQAHREYWYKTRKPAREEKQDE
jgi:NTE family protein